jgi:hypothetical protein
MRFLRKDNYFSIFDLDRAYYSSPTDRKNGSRKAWPHLILVPIGKAVLF